MPLVTKAADERLNQLNFQMASLRFGMATEIATHSHVNNLTHRYEKSNFH